MNLTLLNPDQFIGYSKKNGKLSSLLFKNNNLHIDILFDLSGKMEINNPDGNQDKLKIHDIYLESVITTICDHEDSVAAVDAEDKVHGYKNWLLLMKGKLKSSFIKKSGTNPFSVKCNIIFVIYFPINIVIQRFFHLRNHLYNKLNTYPKYS